MENGLGYKGTTTKNVHQKKKNGLCDFLLTNCCQLTPVLLTYNK